MATRTITTDKEHIAEELQQQFDEHFRDGTINLSESKNSHETPPPLAITLELYDNTVEG